MKGEDVLELIVDLKERSYPILIEKGLINKVAYEVQKVFKGEKIFILTDENVNGFYGEKVMSLLQDVGYEVKKLVLKPGEETKNYRCVEGIYNELLDFKLTRSDLIITLGGGVIGDLGGFVASTFLRGVDFIQFPTSLLAQVDSSVGGKVGVDIARGKNLVGSFYHPKAVLIDPEVLNTLKPRFFNDGMAEVIKYGCIKDKEFFYELKKYKNKEEVINNISTIIHNCCKIKRNVVEKDEKDKGDRMLLNFGHTLGHGIEQYYEYKKHTHGEGVAIGMYAITKISEAKGLTKDGTAEEIKELLVQYALPFETDVKIANIMEAISLDKKNIDGKLNVILIKEMGESFIYKTDTRFFN
ncbi:3-dehydroquinate synthase [Clostridium gasigenes]|uniref:3-dehydroquinate synthase n=1 Tax=Clostridium gasigenes TaxID=94869 RepID=UPI001C0C3EB7|nr:3-dehydroquinate synthase [Clostridium gasigenes]MBU3137080.1 3-dehydroquinate synthase [Clostridium gasigenes]